MDRHASNWHYSVRGQEIREMKLDYGMTVLHGWFWLNVTINRGEERLARHTGWLPTVAYTVFHTVLFE
jgi:hypothetical protein